MPKVAKTSGLLTAILVATSLVTVAPGLVPVANAIPNAACTILGTSGDDVLSGTSGDDVICGRGGNDTITGRGGNDVLYGDGGNDTISGGGGLDRLIGGAGDDVLRGGALSDDIRGGPGNDEIYGNAGPDTLRGSAGDDVVRGGAGNDLIYGNNGADLLVGGDGDDVITGSAGTDEARGGAGSDACIAETESGCELNRPAAYIDPFTAQFGEDFEYEEPVAVDLDLVTDLAVRGPIVDPGEWVPPIIAPITSELLDISLAEVIIDATTLLDDTDPLTPLGSNLVSAGWIPAPDLPLPLDTNDPLVDDGLVDDGLIDDGLVDDVGVLPGVVEGVISLTVLDETELDGSGLSKVAFTIEADPLAIAAAGLGGVLRLAVDYDAFRFAYGGDWAGRLQIATFDTCWLTAANRVPGADCERPQVVADSYNALQAGVISFDVPLSVLDTELLNAVPDAQANRSFVRALQGSGGQGLGFLPAGSSGTGDFGATDLDDAADWDVSLNGGSFSWSNSVPFVAPPAGPTPDLSVNYSSGSIDGLTADENTQGGVLGVGWSTGSEAFIEREYRTCNLPPQRVEDRKPGVEYTASGNTAAAGNLCFWSPEPNGTAGQGEARYRMSLQGHAGVLVRWAETTRNRDNRNWEVTRYRLEDDTGLEVLRWRSLDDATARGSFGVDNDREFFTATDPAGNEYWFGHGNADGNIESNLSPNDQAPVDDATQPDGPLNSLLTVPVIANEANEPCNALSGGGWCHQGYRWMLDRVVDSTDLAMVYLYDLDKNTYKSELFTTPDSIEYVSAAVLSRVFYGSTRQDAATPAKHTGMAEFTYIFRCTNVDIDLTDPNDPDFEASCADPVGSDDAELYPDLPLDKICITSDGCGNTSPSFMQRRFLVNISTFARRGPSGGATPGSFYRYAGLDIWHGYFVPLPGEHPRPFVNAMQRVGFNGTSPDDQIGETDDPNGGLRLPLIEFKALATFDGADIDPDNPDRPDIAEYCGPEADLREGAGATDDGLRLDGCGVRANRVNNWLTGSTNVAPMGMFRINRIYDDKGLETRIEYSTSDEECEDGIPTGTWRTNHYRCYAGVFEGEFVAFNKYVVTEVRSIDLEDSSTPDLITRYDYLERSEDPNGGALWARSEETLMNSHRDFRGYHQVTVTTGNPGNPTEQDNVTRHQFMRGANGHPNAVPIVTANGDAVVDVRNFAGFEFDTVQLESGTTNAVFSRTSTKYEIKTHAVSPPDDLGRVSRAVRTEAQFREYNGEYSATTYDYDNQFHHLTETVELGRTNASYTNIGGPTTSTSGTAPDDRCMTNEYTNPNFVFIDGLIHTTTTYPNTTCTGTAISRTEMDYDAFAHQQIGLFSNGDTGDVIDGQITEQRVTVGDSASVAGNPTELVTNIAYESAGWKRVVRTNDARNIPTFYQYRSFDQAGEPGNFNTEQVTVTTPDGNTVPGVANIVGGYQNVVSMDVFGRTIETRDPDGRITTMCYDRLDRLIDVYLPDNTQTAACSTNDEPVSAGAYFNFFGTPPPSQHYQYALRLEPAVLPATRTDPNVPAKFVPTPSWVMTSERLHSKASDVYFYETRFVPTITAIDAFGRTTETATQSPTNAPTPSGSKPGWILSVSRYDDVGRLLRQSDGQWTPDRPTYDRTLTSADVERDYRTIYDQVGRATATDLLNNNTLVRTQVTSYPLPGDMRNNAATGYTVRTFPAQNVVGGTVDPIQYGPTDTTTDTYGNTVRVDQHLTDDTPAAPTIELHTRRYEYNMRFDKTRIIDPLGADTYMTYNNLSWPTSIDDPNAGYSTMDYHQTGQVRTTVDARGETITTAIDAAGRLERQVSGTDTTDTTERLAEMTYDPAGRSGAVNEAVSYQPAGVEAHRQTAGTFDSIGRPTSWSITVTAGDGPAASDDPLGAQFDFATTYTRSGSPHRVTYPATGPYAQEEIEHYYSGLGDMITVRERLANGSYGTRYVDAHYVDKLGRTSVLNTGPAADTQLANFFEYSDNTSPTPTIDDGRLATHVVYSQHQNGGRDPIVDMRYTYDAPGNPTQERDIVPGVGAANGHEQRCHNYDSRQRLINSYTIEANGNATPNCPGSSTTPTGPAPYNLDYAYDQADRFTLNADRTLNTYNGQVTGPACATSPNGNNERRAVHAYSELSAGNGQLEQDFEYDCTGALTRREVGSGFSWTHTYDERQRLTTTQKTGETASSNVYDHTGQRVLRVDPNGDRTIYMGTSELRYNNTTNQITAARHYPGGGTRVFDDTGTTLTWTATDQQNSIIATVDDDTGQHTDTRYDPYGAIRQGQPTADKAFLNQTQDTQQDLTYLNHRHYNPDLGMFTAVDPLVTMTGEPYMYASANPVTYSDPSGLCTFISGRCHFGDGSVYDPETKETIAGGDRIGGLVSPEAVGAYVPARYQQIRDTPGEPQSKIPYLRIEKGEWSVYSDGVKRNFLGGLDWLNQLRASKNRVEESWIFSKSDSSDSLGNARKHALLAAWLTWTQGEDRARVALDAHENIVDGQLLAGHLLDPARAMDLVNNEVGIQIGLQLQAQLGDPPVQVPGIEPPSGTPSFEIAELRVLSQRFLVYLD